MKGIHTTLELLVEQLFRELPLPSSPEQILNKACDVINVPLSDLVSAADTVRLRIARGFCIYALRVTNTPIQGISTLLHLPPHTPLQLYDEFIEFSGCASPTTVSSSLTRRSVNELWAKAQNAETLDSVVELAAQHYHLPPMRLYDLSQTEYPINVARAVAMYLLRAEKNIPVDTIAALFSHGQNIMPPHLVEEITDTVSPVFSNEIHVSRQHKTNPVPAKIPPNSSHFVRCYYSLRLPQCVNTLLARPTIITRDVIVTVARTTGLSEEQIKSRKRTAPEVAARAAIAAVLRKGLGLPYESIGKLIGGRDHTTIIHILQKLEVAGLYVENYSTESQGPRMTEIYRVNRLDGVVTELMLNERLTAGEVIPTIAARFGLEEKIVLESRGILHSAIRAAAAVVFRERFSMSLGGCAALLDQESYTTIIGYMSKLRNAGLYPGEKSVKPEMEPESRFIDTYRQLGLEKIVVELKNDTDLHWSDVLERLARTMRREANSLTGDEPRSRAHACIRAAAVIVWQEHYHLSPQNCGLLLDCFPDSFVDHLRWLKNAKLYTPPPYFEKGLPSPA